jgi:hypothetical protein
MAVGVTIGLVSMLSVVAVYFWVVRRANHEVAEQK